MKVKIFIVLNLVFTLGFSQLDQNVPITGNFENIPLDAILDSISLQSGYYFSYNSSLLPKGSRFSISADAEAMTTFLSRLLTGTNLKFSFYKDQVILNFEKPKQISGFKKKYRFRISGKVLDDEQNPLSGANVFLDGTTLGTFTDIDGNYKLNSIPAGSYDIVFSHVGFKNSIYQVSEYHGDDILQNHQMILDLEELEEVEVISNRINSSQSSWHAYYATFKEELLGLTSNGLNSVVENPEVLHFSFDRSSETLTASADSPITIRNEALGYHITYFLETFKKTENNLRYRGNVVYQDLVPINKGEKTVWKKNRSVCFSGSFNHFKRALLNHELSKEGFRIYHIKDANNPDFSKERELSESDILVFKGSHYELNFKDDLLIEFRREVESIDFLSKSEFATVLYTDNIDENGILIRDPGNQISVLRLLKSNVRIDPTGQILDKFAVTTFGYWAWERLADLVPLNYDPKSDKF